MKSRIKVRILPSRTTSILRALRVLGALLVISLVTAKGWAQEPQTCLACHGGTVNAQKFTASAHGALGCGFCHAGIKSYPHPQKLTPVDCSTCHAEEVASYEQSIHGQKRAQGVAQAPDCSGCHGNVHGILRHTDADSPVNRTRLAATCAACHAGTKLGKEFRIPVVRPVEAYLKSVHAEAVAEGKPGAVCSDCHGSHGILSAQDPRSSIWRTNVPETCGKCHAQILTQFRNSVHGKAVARGVSDAPVCTDCHGEHRILSPESPSSPVFAGNVARETCVPCHSSIRLSERYGLPLNKVTTFEESFHGLALRTGQITAANCASCHGVHDILPSSDPQSKINPANLPGTCGKCHPGAGTRFALGPVHVLPTTNATPLLFWIRTIYLWLIGITVAFMLLHNLMDLVRKARREEPPVKVRAGAGKERMPRILRWQHGLVMLSFPLLVYSGFALIYPESWWAQPLLAWETQFGLRGGLHRIAACILMGSLLWHLVHLIVSRQLRRKLSGLKLKLRDVRDVIRVQRYYLGLDPRPPHLGKFSYTEKVEYWAFLWGTVIMSLTGLLLWFANFSLQYFPKWVTDAATAIHFYEAILATLSILVWHFYWVIFDPDVYPMDTAWWQGRSSAAREAERGEAADSGNPDTQADAEASKTGDAQPKQEEEGQKEGDH